MKQNCICCNSSDLTCVGTIASTISFAGRWLKSPLAGGSLMKCSKCGMAFRYPHLGKEELDSLYLEGKTENWQSPISTRKDWQIASQWINENLPIDSKVLDVGCFDGLFLNSLPRGYQRFGIEIHEAAGNKAKESGINLVGRDFAEFPEKKSHYDVVASFDVIEHTLNPLDFLKDMAEATRDGGYIIVSTGNCDAFTWKLAGARYWYCTTGEHISFISPQWCEWVGSITGLNLKQVIKYSHLEASLIIKVSDAIKNLIYLIMPSVFALLKRIKLGDAEYRIHKERFSQPPAWMTAKDHFICIFEKHAR